MKVVLKHTVFDRIVERIHAARSENREVDYIVVSERERDELEKDRRTREFFRHQYDFTRPGSDPEMDAKFTTWEFKKNRPTNEDWRRGRDYIRVCSYETFMGHPLLTVPAEYMPD